ncbi:sushi, nidogen and EGF-like domain-containing protein 1 [Aulostomus maculatus]
MFFNQYTSGSVLQQATSDIQEYFPELNFTASWVFVATWYVVPDDETTGTQTTVQAVLISGGQDSFVLMNYGTIASTSQTVQAGYDTIGSSHYFSIPGSFSDTATGSNSTFRLSSNVNVPGRWAFRVDDGPLGSTYDEPLYTVIGAPTYRPLDEYSTAIDLTQPFGVFGRSYNKIYVNGNGHLTFVSPLWHMTTPHMFPAHSYRDIIAPFWTDLNNALGVVFYNQYTSGSVLQQATSDIQEYFPELNFTASWVFVATWYVVLDNPANETETTVQAVLISGLQFSFVLMNYGKMATTTHSVQAGYDTIGSTHYFSIPGSFSDTATGSNSTFRLSSNVNVPGRWAFRVNDGPRGLTFNGM